MLVEMTELLGRQVYTPEGRLLGEVDNVVVDVDGAKIDGIFVAESSPLLVDESQADQRAVPVGLGGQRRGAPEVLPEAGLDEARPSAPRRRKRRPPPSPPGNGAGIAKPGNGAGLKPTRRDRRGARRSCRVGVRRFKSGSPHRPGRTAP